jgi:hypothetical protein
MWDVQCFLFHIICYRYLLYVSVVYEEELNNDEGKAIKVEYESETNKGDDYKQQTPWKLAKVIHKQDSINVIQPRGVISGESSSVPEVLEEEVAHSQDGSTVFEIAPGAGSSKPLRNYGVQKDPYTPLDVHLVPVTNASMDVSGIDYEFSEDSSDENNQERKGGSEKPSLETTQFIVRSET